MTRAARHLLAVRTARDAARTRFDDHLAQVREDLDARGVGGRIADSIEEQARGAWHTTVEVAEENPGIIAGTIAALAIWLLRNPIIARLDEVLGRDGAHKGER
ncbi:MAG TPA: hypothetical protein VJM34_01110 [Novosphingobium sp.]|nr:hypothetical protein [Novosphingobium sp.]